MADKVITIEQFTAQLERRGVAPDVAEKIAQGVKASGKPGAFTSQNADRAAATIVGTAGATPDAMVSTVVASLSESADEAAVRKQEEFVAAVKSGNPQAVASFAANPQQVENPAEADLLTEQVQNSGLMNAIKVFKMTITPDEYQRAKQMYEDVHGKIDDQTFATLVGVGSPDIVDAFNVAKGYLDQSVSAIRTPNGKSYQVESDIYANAQKYLAGSQRFKNVFNRLAADQLEQSSQEWAWTPLVAYTHGVFDDADKFKLPESDFEAQAQASTSENPSGVDNPELAGKDNTGWFKEWRNFYMQKLGHAPSEDERDSLWAQFKTEYETDQARGASKRQEVNEYGRSREAQKYVDQFNAYRTRFGNEFGLAALVGTHDEALAEKMMGVGLTDREALQVQKYLRNVDPAQLGLLDDLKLYMEDYKRAQAKASQGPQIVMPDRTKISEGFRELYRSWFRAEPGEGELEAMVSDLESKYVGEVSANREFDFDSRMKEQARSSDLYSRLFANRQAGVSEEDYVRQFEQAGSALLGGEVASDQAVQAGLASGSTQATVGAVAGSAQAWENSSWRERVAQAAQVLNKLT